MRAGVEDVVLHPFFFWCVSWLQFRGVRKPALRQAW